jgi:hypothetical protein
MYSEHEKKISNILQGIPKIAFTLDAWKSQFNSSFLAVTVHFLDDKWHLRDLLIGFALLTEAQTGMYLWDPFIAVIEWFQLGKKIMSITTDNGLNVLSMLKFLETYSCLPENSGKWCK